MYKRFLATVGTVLIMGAVSAAGAVGLCDYRPPKTDLVSLWLAGTYRYFDSPGTPGVEVNAGRAGVSFSRLYDSPSLGYSLTAIGELGVVNLAPSSAAGQGSGTLRHYVAEGEPYFGFVGFDGGYATGQPRPGLTVSVGAGYGRFTDVTPLAKAFRIQAILFERKTISAALGDEVLLAVGKEIGRRVEYADVKDLVAAVVGLIERASGVKVDPRTVLMIEDEIIAPGRERYCGWVVQAGIGYELVDPYDGPRDVVVTASANAAYPPEPGSQLLFRAAAAGPFDIVNQHTVTFTVSYERALSPTLWLQGNLVLQRVKPLNLAAMDSISGTFQVTFSIGAANIGISLSVGRAAGAAEWSKDLSILLTMKLL